jgi:hypothetical protein
LDFQRRKLLAWICFIIMSFSKTAEKFWKTCERELHFFTSGSIPVPRLLYSGSTVNALFRFFILTCQAYRMIVSLCSFRVKGFFWFLEKYEISIFMICRCWIFIVINTEAIYLASLILDLTLQCLSILSQVPHYFNCALLIFWLKETLTINITFNYHLTYSYPISMNFPFS